LGLNSAISLFNTGHYFEAHEVLETQCWLGLPLTPEKLFFQGLIQLSAGFVHWQNGNTYGFKKKLTQCFQKLEGVWILYGKPTQLAGIQVKTLVQEIKFLLEANELPIAPLVILPFITD
jgi:predicted metal-dependent hydrolase